MSRRRPIIIDLPEEVDSMSFSESDESSSEELFFTPVAATKHIKRALEFPSPVYMTPDDRVRAAREKVKTGGLTTFLFHCVSDPSPNLMSL